MSFRLLTNYLFSLLILLSCVAVVFGVFHTGGNFRYWTHSYFSGFLLWVFGFFLSSVIVRYFFFVRAKLVILCLMLLFLFCGVGWINSISVFLVIGSVYISGFLIGKKLFHKPNTPLPALCFAIGFVVFLSVFGILIHFPINYQYVYWLVILFPYILFLYLYKLSFFASMQGFVNYCDRLLSGIAYWQWSLGLCILGFVATHAFILHITSDDGALHMALWSQLTFAHQYLFDVKTQIWSVAPFALDLLHAVPALMINESVRGALNLVIYFSLLVSIAIFIYHLLGNAINVLISIVLFASTPLISNFLLGLQTDLFLALVVVVAVNFFLRQKFGFKSGVLYLSLFVAVMLAIKLPMVLMAGSLGILFFWGLLVERNMRQDINISFFYIAVFFCCLFAALHSYVAAYFLTENPFFPLYNAIFKSPYYDSVNIHDVSFNTGMNIKTYLAMFFETSKHLESKNFVTGFQYVFLFPLGVLYCFFIKDKHALKVLMSVLVYGLVMFYMIQYVRYFFLLFPLMTYFVASFLYELNQHNNCFIVRYINLGVMFFLVSVNLLFLPGASWVFQGNNLSGVVNEEQRFIEPEHKMNDYVHQNFGVQKVIFDVSRAYGATLLGYPIYYCWYSPLSMRDAGSWLSWEDSYNYVKNNNIRFVYWFEPNAKNDDYFRPQIKTLLDHKGRLIHSIDGLMLYEIEK